MAQIKVYGTAKCISTKRALELMDALGKAYDKIDILTTPVPKWILSKIVVSWDIGAAFNHHHPDWHKIRDKRFTKASAIEFLQKKPEFIRRPIIVKGREVFQGYDEEELRKFLK